MSENTLLHYFTPISFIRGLTWGVEPVGIEGYFFIRQDMHETALLTISKLPRITAD